MAKSVLDGTEWTVTEFAGLLPEKRKVARQELACLSCDGPAVFRAGQKRRPSFAARHRDGCQLVSPTWSAFEYLAGPRRHNWPAGRTPPEGDPASRTGPLLVRSFPTSAADLALTGTGEPTGHRLLRVRNAPNQHGHALQSLPRIRPRLTVPTETLEGNLVSPAARSMIPEQRH